MNSLEASLVPLVSPATDVPRLFKLDRRKRLACRAQLPKASSCLVSDAQQNAVASSEPVSRKVMEMEKNVFVGTYARAPVVIQSGKGCKLYDVDGKEYLDMTAGIAVNSLGHGDPDWVNAVVEQAHTLTHVSNVYYSIPQWPICMDNAGDSWKAPPVANSGTEANEAAIKFARRFQRFSHPDKKLPATEFIAFTHSFHGRTMGSVALTSKEHYRLPFEPVMSGVKFIEYGNFEEAKKAIQHGKTAAVFIEPIQGEGGIYSATKDFLRALRTACDDAGALLVFDEVQCGLGRTGQLWLMRPLV